MKKIFAGLTAAIVAASALGVTAFAATPKAKAAKMATPMCPFCKMPLATKKSAKTPVAIKMNGKTYYTCAPCKAKVAAMEAKKPAKM